MKLGRYTFFSLLLIVAVGAYVNISITNELFTIVIFGEEYTLLVAVWIMILLSIFYIITMSHMIFYSMKFYFKGKVLTSDYEKMINLIISRILNKDEKFIFKTNEYKNLSTIIKQITFEVNSDFVCDMVEVSELVELISSIHNGKYMKIKRLGLDDQHPLSIKNTYNRLESDNSFIFTVLKNSSEYNNDIVRRAYEILIKNHDSENIKKYLNLITLDKELLLLLLGELKESLDFSMEELKSMCKTTKLSQKDYIEIAKILKYKINPDELIEMSESLQSSNEDMSEALLYILFDLEMVDKAKDLLDSYDESEFIQYRSFLILKESGHNFAIDKFLNM